MALYTIQRWQEDTEPRAPLQICDVGGAGSNFWQLLHGLTPDPILVIDSAAPDRVWRDGEPVQYWRESVEEFATHGMHNQFDVITCISVIEHVEELRKFFRACHMLLKPGGLLFLTTDYWDAEGDDTAHFHWMRKRIYNAARLQRLIASVRDLGFTRFGAPTSRDSWEYPGPQVYDYSVASVALTRKGL